MIILITNIFHLDINRTLTFLQSCDALALKAMLHLIWVRFLKNQVHGPGFLFWPSWLWKTPWQRGSWQNGELWCECWQYLWHNAEILIRGLVVGRGVLIATKRGVNASRRPPNALIADCWRIVVDKSSSLSSLFGSLVVLIISTIYKHIWHIFWFSLTPPMWKKNGLKAILHLWKLFVFIIKEAHQAW